MSKQDHKFHMRLPRNGREFPVFLLIVSLISVSIIGPLAAMFTAGFSFEVWGNVLKALPVLWLVVVFFVIVTNKPARWLTNKLILPTDSFYARTIVELLFNVALMSIIMTIAGSWIGIGQISWIALQDFFYNWPRNFAVAFAVESLIAHPVAHFVMHHYHLRKDGGVDSRLIKPIKG